VGEAGSIRLAPKQGGAHPQGIALPCEEAVAGAEARAQGRMPLSQAMEAMAGAGRGKDSGRGRGRGRGGAEPMEVSSESKSCLKKTQTCKSRGCYDAGREHQIERFLGKCNV